MAMPQAEAALETIRRVEGWAARRGVKLPPSFAGDLGEAYRSAQVLIACVDELLATTASAEGDAKLLAQMEAWTYSDLVDHLDRLRRPLSEVIDLVLERRETDSE